MPRLLLTSRDQDDSLVERGATLPYARLAHQTVARFDVPRACTNYPTESFRTGRLSSSHRLNTPSPPFLAHFSPPTWSCLHRCGPWKGHG